MILCKWCGVRPAREAELKWGHRRCSQCRVGRFREGRKKWTRTYYSTPGAKARHVEKMRKQRERMVYVAGQSIVFPTVELKQQAAELISRRRDEFIGRLKERAQAESSALGAISPQAAP